MHTIVTANWVLVYCLNVVYYYTLLSMNMIYCLPSAILPVNHLADYYLPNYIILEGIDCANKGVYVSLHHLHKTCTIYNLAYTKLSLLSQMDV